MVSANVFISNVTVLAPTFKSIRPIVGSVAKTVEEILRVVTAFVAAEKNFAWKERHVAVKMTVSIFPAPGSIVGDVA